VDASSENSRVDEFDIAIVGYGPVGQTMAALMGRLGYSVIVFERHDSLFANARASRLDHETLQMWDGIGVTELLENELQVAESYRWLNGGGRKLMDIEYEFEPGGYASVIDCYQPHFEAVLASVNDALPNVEVRQGWQLVEIEPGDSIRIVAERQERRDDGRRAGTGELREVKARFCIGADGRNSAVREMLGMTMKEYEFHDGPYINCDTVQRRDLSSHSIRVSGHEYGLGKGDIWLVCDPERPMITVPSGSGFRKFGWYLNPGERVEDFLDPAGAWEIIARWGLGPSDVEIARISEYTFEAKLADDFRAGNVFLIGDAAHLMPPHMGQGLRNGLRDAKNLSWKLDHVLRGLAGAELLGTYEEERKPHADAWIQSSVALGEIFMMSDPQQVEARDEAFFNHLVPPPAPDPALTGRVFAREGASSDLAGHLAPQGFVNDGERTGHLERIDPSFRFRVLFRDDRTAQGLTEEDEKILESLDIRTVTFADEPNRQDRRFEDVGGAYTRFLDEHDLSALVIRPDFYIFGAARTADELSSVLAELEQSLSADSHGN
jgi:2-polyprenyl-6-methoxyphenol hydroxylase-like FAD-dependent oxidoreductase